MVDSKNMTPYIQNYLRELPYQRMVQIYDDNCDGCPFALIQVREVKKVLAECANVDEAIQVMLAYTDTKAEFHIFRGCKFNDTILTLREIIMNTCRFWKVETCEGGDNEKHPSFIEVEKQEEISVEYQRNI